MASAGNITGTFRGIVTGLSSAVRNLGLVMTGASVAVGAALVGLSKRAGRVAEAFREVDTISRSVADAQAEYGELVKDINTQFGLQANRLDVIEGLYQSVSAGITEGAESQRAFLESAAQLAAVGRVDLAETVDILSTVLNTYNMNASKADDVSRTLFSTVQFGKVRMEELAPVMGRVAALGSDVGVSIEQLGASMAVLTRTGFSARIAATGLRNIMRSFMRPSESMKNILEQIALENDQIASQWQRQSQTELPDVVTAYKETKTAVQELEEAQASLRREQSELSLGIQRARLAIQAIEQDRISQLEDLQTKRLAQNNTVEQLETQIESYRLKLNEARIQEEESRIQAEKHQEAINKLKEDFKNNVAMAGDLEDGLGSLVLEQQGLVDTLVQLRKRANENNMAFDELFPRTRALQGALALVGEDGQQLKEIFTLMENQGDLTQEQIADLASELDDMSQKDVKNAIEEMQNMEGLMEEVRGPTQDLRDAQSKLKQAVSDLGRIFKEDVIDALENFADAITTAVDKINSLEQTVQEQISEFTVLGLAIGLVLGPLLFFAGQLGLIAQSLGVGLIPLVGTLAVAIGGLSLGFEKAASDGESAGSMFTDMQSLLGRLINFVLTLRDAFIQEVLPGMEDFAVGVLSVIQAVFDGISQETGEGESIIFSFASSVGQAFSTVGTFLQENSDTVSKFVGFLTSGLINEVIPAIQNFAGFVVEKGIPRLEEFADKILNEVKPAAMEMKKAIIEVVNSLIEFAQSEDVKEILSFLEDKAVSLASELNDLVVNIANFVSENSDLIAEILVMAGIFAGLVPVIAPIIEGIIVLGSALVGLASAKGAVAGLGSVISLLGGPITLIAAAVAALAAAWITDFGGIRSKLEPLIEVVKDVGGSIADSLAPTINDVIGAVILLGGYIEWLITWFIDFLSESKAVEVFILSFIYYIKGMANTISGAIRIVINIIRAIIRAFEVVFAFLTGGDVEGASEAFADALESLGRSVVQFFKGLGQLVMRLILTAFGNVLLVFGDILGGITDILGDVWGRIKSVLPSVSDIVGFFKSIFFDPLIGNSVFPDLIDDIISLFTSLPGKIVEAVSGAFSTVYEKFREIVGNIVDTYTDIIDWYIDLASKILDKIPGGEAFKDIGGDIAGWIVDKFSDIVGWYANIATKISQALPSAEKIKEVGKDIAGKVKDGIEAVFSTFADLMPISMEDAKQWGKSLVEQIAEGIRNAEDAIKDAIHDAAGALAKFLPSSPAEKGPLSKSGKPPKESGEALMNDMAAGILMRSPVIESAVSDAMNVQEPTATPETGGSSVTSSNIGGGGSDDTEANVSEKAVYFEEGAFQGVSDEELPQKVRKEVDGAMNEIVDRIESTGGDSGDVR